MPSKSPRYNPGRTGWIFAVDHRQASEAERVSRSSFLLKLNTSPCMSRSYQKSRRSEIWISSQILVEPFSGPASSQMCARGRRIALLTHSGSRLGPPPIPFRITPGSRRRHRAGRERCARRAFANATMRAAAGPEQMWPPLLASWASFCLSSLHLLIFVSGRVPLCRL